VQSIREELLDRFGELPEEAVALLAVAQLAEIVDTSLLTWVTEVVNQLTKASTT